MSHIYIILDQFSVSSLRNVELGEFSRLEDKHNAHGSNLERAVKNANPSEVTFLVTGSQGRLLRPESKLVTVLVRHFSFSEKSFIDSDKYNVVAIDFSWNKVVLEPGDTVFSISMRNAFELLAYGEHVNVTPSNVFDVHQWDIKGETLPVWAREKLSIRQCGNRYAKDAVLKLDDETFIAVVTKTRGVKVNHWDEEPYCHEEVTLVTKNGKNKIIYKTPEYNEFAWYPDETVTRLHISRSGKSVVLTIEEDFEYDDEDPNLLKHIEKTHPILLSEIL